VIRIWEVDPTPVLETNDPKLLPWALLMKSTDEQVRRIAAIVAGLDNDEPVARFLTLGRIRYHRDALNEMVGGGRMGLLQAILDGKDMEVERERAAAAGKAQGLAEGQAVGRAEGRAVEARKILRLLLQKHFPALASLTEVDMISDPDTLDSIIESVVNGASAEPVRTAILSAAQTN
jgi:hypothetical protein